MKIISGLIQGTQEWLQWRRNHIGASEASAILGLNPFRTKLSVWEEKVLGWEQPINQKMIDGTKGEQAARDAYEKMSGRLVAPIVAESTEYPFISASFDGMSLLLDHAVEIKCGRSSHKYAQLGEIAPYYIPQLQQQMYVAGLDSIHYFSYYNGEGILLTEYRSEEFIKKMVEKLIEFWDNVQAGTPPKD